MYIPEICFFKESKEEKLASQWPQPNGVVVLKFEFFASETALFAIFLLSIDVLSIFGWFVASEFSVELESAVSSKTIGIDEKSNSCTSLLIARIRVNNSTL